MTIANILKDKGDTVETVGTDRTVADAVALLAERRIGAVPVVEGDRVVGVFSERDVVYCVQHAGAGGLSRSVGEVMTTPAVTVTPADSVIAALALMTRRRIRHLPVMNDDRLVGIVSIGDLVKHRIERIESEAAQMRDYIQSA